MDVILSLFALGFVSSITMGNMVSTLLIGIGLFAYYTKPGNVHFPGAPFIMGAMCLLISAFLAYRSMKKDHAIPAFHQTNNI